MVVWEGLGTQRVPGQRPSPKPHPSLSDKGNFPMSNTFLIYGKIIIDDIRLNSGEIVAGKLGGGSPQAAFGMRLWHDDVALLTRSGDDLDASHLQTLQDLGVDLSGWVRYADLPTPHGVIEYD